jgi:regulator of PEP synthase PpsR (kinase-PPPase family)
MNKEVAERLKKDPNAKLMLINKELEGRIKELCDYMGTDALDVLETSLKLLQMALNKKVILRDVAEKTEMEIDALEHIEPKDENNSDPNDDEQQ